MDYMLYAAGCGWQNPELDTARDRSTLEVNVVGFTRIINAAYTYFRDTANRRPGHIAAITSVAGTKGIGISATYSASKRYQWTYLQALDQLAHIQHVDVAITDIRPGFVDTPLLVHGKDYPIEMSIAYAAPCSPDGAWQWSMPDGPWPRHSGRPSRTASGGTSP